MAQDSNAHVRSSADALVNPSEYETKDIQIGTSTFHLYGRKKGGNGLEKIEKSLLKMWTPFSAHFNKQPAEIAIVDFEDPLGGGPLAPFVVGIFRRPLFRKRTKN